MVALNQPASPTPLRPPRRGWRPDAVSVLTLLIASAFLIPARYTFRPLGGAGRLDMMLGVGLLGWWAVTRSLPGLAVRTRQPMRWVLLALLASMFVSAAFAYQRGLSTIEYSGIERNLLGWLSSVGVVLVTIDGVRNSERADVLLKRIVALGLFVAFVADIQFFLGYDLTFQLRPPGLSPNIDLRSVELRNVVARVYGTSLHPIEFGVLMSVLGAVSAHYALVAATRAERQRRWLYTAILVGSGLLSVSRSAVVSLAVVLLGFLFVWRPRMWLNGLVAGAAGLVGVRLLAPGLLGTIRGLFVYLGSDDSISGRTNDYGPVFALIDKSFWFGRGPGTFNVEEYFVLDNQWLVQLVSTGFVTTIILAALFFLAVAQANHLFRRARTDEVRHLGHTLMIVVLVFVISSFFFDSLGYPQIRSFTMVSVGLIGALWSAETGRADPTILRPGRRIMRSSRSMVTEDGRPEGGRLVQLWPGDQR